MNRQQLTIKLNELLQKKIAVEREIILLGVAQDKVQYLVNLGREIGQIEMALKNSQ